MGVLVEFNGILCVSASRYLVPVLPSKPVRRWQLACVLVFEQVSSTFPTLAIVYDCPASSRNIVTRIIFTWQDDYKLCYEVMV